MFDTPEIMQRAQAFARYAADRQTAIAGNVANADTPGYRGRDLPAFDPDAGQLPLRRTRAEHFGAGSLSVPGAEVRAKATSLSPNGNDVSLEDEMVASVEARRQHDLALAIYGNALTMLRSTLGRR
ncbi:FlgB family protein [Frigidibacter sp. MR17.14]|uniref:FlgB family protein n=1 Tax=Frigidibacter sp. MR17.14 TaxID=3126509 RepID=UPI003012DC29